MLERGLQSKEYEFKFCIEGMGWVIHGGGEGGDSVIEGFQI
mgnify:FL=1